MGGGGLNFGVGEDCTGGGDIFQREGMSKFSAGGGRTPRPSPPVGKTFLFVCFIPCLFSLFCCSHDDYLDLFLDLKIVQNAITILQNSDLLLKQIFSITHFSSF